MQRSFWLARALGCVAYFALLAPLLGTGAIATLGFILPGPSAPWTLDEVAYSYVMLLLPSVIAGLCFAGAAALVANWRTARIPRLALAALGACSLSALFVAAAAYKWLVYGRVASVFLLAAFLACLVGAVLGSLVPRGVLPKLSLRSHVA